MDVPVTAVWLVASAHPTLLGSSISCSIPARVCLNITDYKVFWSTVTDLGDVRSPNAQCREELFGELAMSPRTQRHPAERLADHNAAPSRGRTQSRVLRLCWLELLRVKEPYTGGCATSDRKAALAVPAGVAARASATSRLDHPNDSMLSWSDHVLTRPCCVVWLTGDLTQR